MFGNLISSLNGIDFTNLPKLKYLNLRKNEFVEVPLEVSQAYNLTELNLGDNKISHISFDIEILKKLKWLNLSYNEFILVPRELYSSTLDDLLISNNKIKFFDEGLKKLSSLKGLDLSNNEITTLPDEIGEIESLVKINIKSNR